MVLFHNTNENMLMKVDFATQSYQKFEKYQTCISTGCVVKPNPVNLEEEFRRADSKLATDATSTCLYFKWRWQDLHRRIQDLRHTLSLSEYKLR